VFLDPHDALPLPPHPNLDQYKKRAKDLLKAARSPNPSALQTWAADWIASLVRLSNLTLTPQLPVRIDHWMAELEKFARKELPQATWGRTHSSVPRSKARTSEHATLTAAQFVIARAHGFESWPQLANHIESVSRANSAVDHFEKAVDAIITGDKTTLADLLRKYPALIHARSTRRHQATLLHYVGANGVEDYRQKTPPNIVEITNLLLDSGADVNATADLYGGSTTLSLVATSVHPERSRVQNALLQILLDHGAIIDAPNSPTLLVNVCLANGRANAAEFLANHGAKLDLEAAAGLGRLNAVKAFFDESGTLASTTSGTQMQKERALLWACEYGHNPVVDFLLARRVPVQSQANTGQTALHWAVIGGQADTIALLLSCGADLEAKNAYGGTPLGQALWSAAHSDSPINYQQIADLLKLHGAKS
jgi:Ankyrin repeats (3 copies)